MRLRISASVSMFIAGLIHLAIAPLHWGHAPAHGLFFILSGLAQVAWGIAFWRKPTTRMQHTGVIMAGGLITLWVITRLLPAPFGDEPGEMEITGIASNLMEGLSFIALIALPVSGATFGKLKFPDWLRVGKFVAVGLITGILVYQIAVLAEPMFPWLGEQSIEIAIAPVENPTKENAYSGAPDDLQLVVAGIASPFSNGSEIPVTDDLLAGLMVTPGDERYSRELAVYLYHQSSSEPVEDASIQATARMRFMDHGTFDQIALNIGGGRYLLLLPFPMPGEWQLELKIGISDQEDTIRFDINLFD